MPGIGYQAGLSGWHRAETDGGVQRSMIEAPMPREFGNALYQATMDRFVSGPAVGHPEQFMYAPPMCGTH
jgi:hypothetical protein